MSFSEIESILETWGKPLSRIKLFVYSFTLSRLSSVISVIFKIQVSGFIDSFDRVEVSRFAYFLRISILEYSNNDVTF
jgi:hypothetical protein